MSKTNDSSLGVVILFTMVSNKFEPPTLRDFNSSSRIGWSGNTGIKRLVKWRERLCSDSAFPATMRNILSKAS